jgi:hypothetical protein
VVRARNTEANHPLLSGLITQLGGLYGHARPVLADGGDGIMTARGNKCRGMIAKVVFGLIIVVSALTIWFAIRGFKKEPNGPVVGSQALAGQAAQRAGASPNHQPVAVP